MSLPSCSICGRSWFAGDHVGCSRRKLEAAHVDWYRRTGHCGQCGNPGMYCTCGTAKRDRCGCHELHQVGSGLRPDALDQFTELETVPVTDEQGELF